LHLSCSDHQRRGIHYHKSSNGTRSYDYIGERICNDWRWACLGSRAQFGSCRMAVPAPLVALKSIVVPVKRISSRLPLETFAIKRCRPSFPFLTRASAVFHSIAFCRTVPSTSYTSCSLAIVALNLFFSRSLTVSVNSPSLVVVSPANHWRI